MKPVNEIHRRELASYFSPEEITSIEAGLESERRLAFENVKDRVNRMLDAEITKLSGERDTLTEKIANLENECDQIALKISFIEDLRGCIAVEIQPK